MPRHSSLGSALGRATRKALTGSSASLATQVKRKARKALTGSSLTLQTQARQAVKKSFSDSARPILSVRRPKAKAGCFILGVICTLLISVALVFVVGSLRGDEKNAAN